MSEIRNIVEQLHRALEADPWHGPSLLQVLEGVTAETASARPLPGSHSIWELLLHVIAWTRAVDARIAGVAIELSGEANFPPVRDGSDRAWRAAIAELKKSHAELFARLTGLSDTDLASPVPGRPYDRAFLLHGLPQHHAYHAGQMALLKKAVESQQTKGAARG